MTKTKRYVNFALIGLSMLFLFNPNIAIIDFLPDFLGYALLCLSLVRLADLNDTVSDALRCFKRLIIIDVAKLLSIVVVFGLTTGQERNSALMLCAFVFGLIEIIFVIPVFLKLFKGLTEIGYIYENETIIPSNKARARGWIGKVKAATVFFVAFKAVMSFLPELSNLTTPEYLAGNTGNYLYRFIGIMRFLAFVPTLCLGALWILLVIVFFIKLNNDKTLRAQIEEAYANTVLPCEHKFITRRVNASLGMLLVAVMLCVDLKIESINILPDFLAAAVFALFISMMIKHTKINRTLGYIACGAFAITSFASTVMETRFFKDFDYDDFYRSVDAYNSYVLMAVFDIINIIAFVCVIALMLLAVKRIVDEHCGRIYISEEGRANARFDKADRLEQYRNLIYCAIGAAVYAATDIAYRLLAVDYGSVMIVNIIGAVIFVGLFFKMYFSVTTAVKNKYILA